MRINPKNIIPQTITILNKLDRKDSATGQDVWYKHTLNNCSWDVTENASQTGTTSNVGQIIKVQIPSRQGIQFLPYNEWKKAGMPDNHFTISLNDYIIKGEVTENITAQNIVQVVNAYEPNTCKIRLFNDLSFDGMLPTFLEQYASIYYIEGV